jgi:hypothetical protein
MQQASREQRTMGALSAQKKDACGHHISSIIENDWSSF